MELFLDGFLVGVAISAPMGSVGIYIVQKIIIKSKTPALIIASGSIVADTLFGIIALFGLRAINVIITEHHRSLSFIGGIILFYISITIFFSKTKDNSRYYDINTKAKDFVTGFIMTITNPITAIAIIGLLAWFGIHGSEISLFSSTILILGLITGLVTWWLTLTGLTSHFKSKIKIKSLKIINHVCGIIIFILALLVLFRVL
jgi:threonine/homoserine/homoserine lactone efflux protein